MFKERAIRVVFVSKDRMKKLDSDNSYIQFVDLVALFCFERVKLTKKMYTLFALLWYRQNVSNLNILYLE